MNKKLSGLVVALLLGNGFIAAALPAAQVLQATPTIVLPDTSAGSQPGARGGALNSESQSIIADDQGGANGQTGAVPVVGNGATASDSGSGTTTAATTGAVTGTVPAITGVPAAPASTGNATATPRSDAGAQAEPMDAPTGADGVQTPSPDGLITLNFPIRAGFTQQPPAEQYVTLGSDVDLSVKAVGLDLNVFTKPKVLMTQWTLGTDGVTWQSNPNAGSYSTTSGTLSNLYAAKIGYGPSYGQQLAVGTYYFQMRISFNAGYYYSNLAKVVVTVEAVSASAVAVTPEAAVVLPNLSYTVNADITPADATNPVTWSANDLLDLTNTSGRGNTFQVDNAAIADQINTDPNTPGLPATLTATVNGLNTATTVYVGGLKAQDLPLDTVRKDGISWPVAGLDKLTAEFYGADSSGNASLTSSTYQWRYYSKNAAGTYTSAAFPTDVQNGSGNFTTPEELDGPQILTIPGNSSFVTAAAAASAAGAPYYVGLTLTLNFSGGSTLTIPTNLAQLAIGEAANALSLVQVPNFSFGTVTGSQLYQGVVQMPLNSVNQGDDYLEIADTRTTASDTTWQLQAQMGPLLDQNKQTIKTASLMISGLATASKVTLTSQNQLVTIADSAHESPGLNQVQGTLTFGANPQLQLSAGQTFSSTITWTLTGSSPQPAVLSH